jgi:DNA-binding transcriptional LysR family regulator
MTHRFATAACALAAVLALAGCGERSEKVMPGAGEPLRVAVSSDAGDAAVYAAAATGQFKAAGLNVTVKPVENPRAALTQLRDGDVDLAVASEPDVLEERARGSKVVSVAALVSSPLTSIIWPSRDATTSLTDLFTKPVGYTGTDYEGEMVKAVFEKAGGKATLKKVPSLFVALTKKQVAAAIGRFGSPMVPPGLPVQPVDHQAVPRFSDYVLVANEDALGPDGDFIRSFIGALARGTRKASLEHIVDDPGAGSALKDARVDVVRRFMLPPEGKPYGWQEPGQWRRFATWMRSRGLKAAPPNGAFTNRFLPGEGL